MSKIRSLPFQPGLVIPENDCSRWCWSLQSLVFTLCQCRHQDFSDCQCHGNCQDHRKQCQSSRFGWHCLGPEDHRCLHHKPHFRSLLNRKLTRCCSSFWARRRSAHPWLSSWICCPDTHHLASAQCHWRLSTPYNEFLINLKWHSLS